MQKQVGSEDLAESLTWVPFHETFKNNQFDLAAMFLIETDFLWIFGRRNNEIFVFLALVAIFFNRADPFVQIMGNIASNHFNFGHMVLGKIISKELFLFLAMVANLFSYEKYLCGIILNLGQWFRRWHFKIYVIYF